ncbi:hypothetical protein ABT112_28725 [Streptomyces sp. NPDC002055]|uniref:hypothetical protein n=1 Tax=Streptomyces sp. NPDC002055 TaxID=3154534 RepID=UPI0033327C87
MTGKRQPQRRGVFAPQATRQETRDAAFTLTQMLDDAGLGGIHPVLDDEKDVPRIRLYGIDADAATRLGHLVRKGMDETYLVAKELRRAVDAHGLDGFPVPQVCAAKIALGEISIHTADRLACILGAPPGPEELAEAPDWPEAKEVYDRLDAAFKAATGGAFMDMHLHSYCRRCEGDPAIELVEITVDTTRRFVKALQSAARP